MSKGEWKGIDDLADRVTSTESDRDNLRKRLQPLLDAFDEMALLASDHVSPRIRNQATKELDTWR